MFPGGQADPQRGPGFGELLGRDSLASSLPGLEGPQITSLGGGTGQGNSSPFPVSVSPSLSWDNRVRGLQVVEGGQKGGWVRGHPFG